MLICSYFSTDTKRLTECYIYSRTNYNYKQERQETRDTKLDNLKFNKMHLASICDQLKCRILNLVENVKSGELPSKLLGVSNQNSVTLIDNFLEKRKLIY